MSKFHKANGTRWLGALIGATGWLVASISAAVDFANVEFTFDGISFPPTVHIPAGQATAPNAAIGTEGFFIDGGPGAVLGEFPIRIGASAADDAANGVLLGYVRENGRNVSEQAELLYATSSTVADGDPTSTNMRNLAGGLALAVHRAGEADAGSAFPTHAPFAANLAAAYFPFSQGWLAGTVSASTNNGALDQFMGSPGLSLGTNFIVDGVGADKHRVVLPGVTDSRRQGLLFVNHAKNEANYAMSEPVDEGDGFVVVTHDNATDGPALTTDPLSFVFIPLGTPNVTMARIHPSSGQDLQPTAMLQSGTFTIAREGDVQAPEFTTGIGGRFRLSIPGESPSSGVLLVSPSTVGRGSNTSSGVIDNIVTYEADGNDWIILTQDLPVITGEGEFSRERNSRFNFAFIPFDAPPTAPAPIQPPAWNRSRIVGWNADLIREAAGEETGGTYATVTHSTSDVPVRALSENYGDYSFSVGGDFMTVADGILFTTVREGLRDNTASGGFFEYGISSAGMFVPEWTVFVDAASPTQGEHEVNIAAAFFGANSGFPMATNVTAPDGMLSLSIPGVADSRTDGVLIAQAWDNEDNFVLASPNPDGTGWDVELHDDGTSFETDELNYVYLPYEAENLVAGRVDEDGSLLSSTDTDDFTLTRDSAGTYRLQIPGKSPETGMLLLTGTGATGSIDNVLAYEAMGSDFLIFGLDMVTSAEQNAGTFVSLEDTEFSFAYIDFNAPPVPPGSGLVGDYNGDGAVDAADYVVWRKQNINGQDGYDAWRADFGRTAPGPGINQAAVPEPATDALLALGALMACALLTISRRAARQNGY